VAPAAARTRTSVSRALFRSSARPALCPAVVHATHSAPRAYVTVPPSRTARWDVVFSPTLCTLPRAYAPRHVQPTVMSPTPPCLCPAIPATANVTRGLGASVPPTTSASTAPTCAEVTGATSSAVVMSTAAMVCAVHVTRSASTAAWRREMPVLASSVATSSHRTASDA